MLQVRPHARAHPPRRALRGAPCAGAGGVCESTGLLKEVFPLGIPYLPLPRQSRAFPDDSPFARAPAGTRFTLEATYHKSLTGNDATQGDPPSTDFVRVSFGWVF